MKTCGQCKHWIGTLAAEFTPGCCGLSTPFWAERWCFHVPSNDNGAEECDCFLPREEVET